jgi:hypothetical protein
VVLFGEGPANIVVSIKPADKEAFEKLLDGDACTLMGIVTEDAQMKIVDAPTSNAVSDAFGLSLKANQLAQAWTTKLPFD